MLTLTGTASKALVATSDGVLNMAHRELKELPKEFVILNRLATTLHAEGNDFKTVPVFLFNHAHPRY